MYAVLYVPNCQPVLTKKKKNFLNSLKWATYALRTHNYCFAMNCMCRIKRDYFSVIFYVFNSKFYFKRSCRVQLLSMFRIDIFNPLIVSRYLHGSDACRLAQYWCRPRSKVKVRLVLCVGVILSEALANLGGWIAMATAAL